MEHGELSVEGTMEKTKMGMEMEGAKRGQAANGSRAAAAVASTANSPRSHEDPGLWTSGLAERDHAVRLWIVGDAVGQAPPAAQTPKAEAE